MNRRGDRSPETHGDSVGVGAFLRSRREEQGIALEQMAEKLRIRPDYVRAIEDDCYEDLPGELFAKGYIRTYAAELEIPEGELPPLLPRNGNRAGCRGGGKRERLVSTVLFAPSRKSRRPWVSVAVAGVVLISLAWWFRGEVTEGPVHVPVAPSPRVLPGSTSTADTAKYDVKSDDVRSGDAAHVGLAETATAAVDAVSAGVPVIPERSVLVTAREMVWLSVTVDEEPEKEHLLRADESLKLQGHIFFFKVGDADGVDIEVDGKPVGPLGPSGELVTFRIPEDMKQFSPAP